MQWAAGQTFWIFFNQTIALQAEEEAPETSGREVEPSDANDNGVHVSEIEEEDISNLKEGLYFTTTAKVSLPPLSDPLLSRL